MGVALAWGGCGGVCAQARSAAFLAGGWGWAATTPTPHRPHRAAAPVRMALAASRTHYATFTLPSIWVALWLASFDQRPAMPFRYTHT